MLFRQTERWTGKMLRFLRRNSIEGLSKEKRHARNFLPRISGLLCLGLGLRHQLLSFLQDPRYPRHILNRAPSVPNKQ